MLALLLRRLGLLPGLLFLLVLGAAHPALATHLLGGEMTYRYLDANGPALAPLRYEITVTVYNNCANNAIRPTAGVGIYDQATGARVVLTTVNYLYTTTTVSKQVGMMDIPQTSLSACIAPVVPPGCTITGVSQPYQLQKFVGVVNLPNTTSGYYALFTDGNRNIDITNLNLPGSQALTLYVSMAPPQLPNHSPVFSDVAVAVICANDTTFLLNNAVDADGDRLVYTFGQPYGTTSGLGVLPVSSFTPPPPLLAYAPGLGYSPTTPFGTAAGNFASINSSTGVAQYGSTNVGGKYAVAVDIREYRTVNGQEVLVGTTRRDLQLVVASCPATKAPVLAPALTLPRSYTMEAGSTLSIPISATQADGHPLTMTLNSALLDGPGGYNAALDGNPGTVAVGNPTGTAQITSTGGTVAGTLVYTAACGEARATPYDVAVIVKDNGCAGKTVFDVLRITVTKPTGPTAIAGDQTVCALNVPHTYTATVRAAPRISWRVVGGTIVGSSTANPVQVQWTATGIGTLVARGVTQYGCLTDSATTRVTVAPASTPVVTGSLTICRGNSTTLALAGGTTYAIVGGPTPLTGAGPFVLSPTQTTTYTITGTNAAGCSATTQATVTVLPLPAAGVGLLARTTCSGVPITLGVTAVAGNTYSWSPSTGLSSATVANPTLTLTNTTSAALTQTYTLTETTATGGCTATNAVAVTVNPAVVAAPGAAVAGCAGGTAQLGAAPVAGFTYSWSPAMGLSNPGIANPTVTLTNTTGTAITQTYTLTTTNAATQCVGTATVAVTSNPLPIAAPGAAIAMCSGTTAQLAATPVAGLTYSWSPATGLSNPSIANPTVTLTNTTGAAITQVYTLTTTNATNCVNTGTLAVTVNPLPGVVPGAAIVICSGGVGQLGSPSVAGLTYSWSPATGLSNPNIANPTVTLTNTTGAATSQTYTLAVTNPTTTCTSSGTVVVTVSPVVAGGTIGTDQTVCAGATPAAFSSPAAASGGTGSYAYQWEISVDNVTWAAIAGATGATYAPGLGAVTTYFRRRATASACGTALSNVVTLTVQPLVTPTVALATPAAQCAGTAFTFSPVPTNAGTAPTYRWFVNNTLVATTATYSSTTLANGDQVRVDLTPTAGFCATGGATATVTISLTPVALPVLVISAQTALPACSGTPVTFRLDNVLNLGASPQYQWQVDGVAVGAATATATANTFTSSTLRDGQVVTLSLRTTTACGAVTVVSNAVRAAITPTPDVEAGPNKEITEGEQVTLEGTAQGTYTLTWTPSATLSFVAGNQLRPVAAPLVTTTYTLTATLGDCTDTSSVTVTVTPRVRIPNAISPNGDGLDDTWEIDNIGAYPASHVLVFNRWGSKIFETNGYSRSNEWNGTISGQPAPVGTYYYVITLGNGKSYSGPLTVVY
ncbi:MAG: gliding motility-associated C-terminal domain-containing protein [Janthinobacterium lividum]